MNNLETAEEILTKYFNRNGYMRIPNEYRRKIEKAEYKKGYEIRFVAKSDSELSEIRQALKKVKFKFGKPFKKNKQIILPVYGKQLFDKFKVMLEGK